MLQLLLIISLFWVTVFYLSAVYILSIKFDLSIFNDPLLFSPSSEGGWLAHHLLISAVVPGKPAEDSPSRYLTKADRESFTLSTELKEILVGLILGDLNILKGKNSTNAGLRFEQSTIHEDYLLHLYALFKGYCLSLPKVYTRSPNVKTGKVYSRVRFITHSLPCFNPFLDLFYPSGLKIIPLNIGDLLTPLGLAYLICDDGSFKKSERAVILCTDGFTLKEVKLLVEVLTHKFNLKCTINKEKNGFRVRISAKSLLILQNLLKDIMPPMMLHKIGLPSRGPI
jgi:hypothetical protein